MKSIGIGTDDFKRIRENDYLFIDKSLFIKDIIDNGSEVLLFPRPRRFGKSLNLSMIKYYFDISIDSKYLFDGLEIMKTSERYTEKINAYPVISISFKDLKKASFTDFINSLKILVSELYEQYEFLLDSDKVSERNKKYFKRYLDEVEENSLYNFIYVLMSMLKDYYGKEVIVLLDEYDAPILEAYFNGFYKEIITFMKSLFSITFKGNLNLHKGIITGVLRISKEGMFSDANNIDIYNITNIEFSEYFGFTESEVVDVLKEYNLDTIEDVKSWYNGYLFKNTTIYNPWSILNYLKNPLHELQVYWVNTGGTSLIEKLVYGSRIWLINEYNNLLETGKLLGVKLDENMSLDVLENNRNTIWTLLMFAGYLTPNSSNENKNNMTLRIPNHEIRENLEDVCQKWFTRFIIEEDIVSTLINHQMESFKKLFTNFTLKSFSYYDIRDDEDENFYHAFSMGLLYSAKNNFKITSNRESGLGRYDLVLEPVNTNYAYIIEFKVARDKDLDKAIVDAFNQIEEKKYDSELESYNTTKIAIAYCGKNVKIEIK